eukprot:5579011-Amphidinium_carterae.1
MEINLGRTGIESEILGLGTRQLMRAILGPSLVTDWLAVLNVMATQGNVHGSLIAHKISMICPDE